jgi:hypothetical protein
VCVRVGWGVALSALRGRRRRRLQCTRGQEGPTKTKTATHSLCRHDGLLRRRQADVLCHARSRARGAFSFGAPLLCFGF